MWECELINHMQSESRTTVTLLNINDMQTLLGKVKYSMHPLSDGWRWPGMEKKHVNCIQHKNYKSCLYIH